MCGIVGLVRDNDIITDLVSGLKALEYRGYDSSGVSLNINNKNTIIKAVGKIENLETKLNSLNLQSNIGIAHTRWATHGEANEINAHPHTSGKIALVHNGILENYAEIKEDLIKEGYVFYSQTDTEVLAKLIDKISQKLPILEAIKEASNLIKGSFAVVIMVDGDDSLYVMRRGSPMVLGTTEDKGNFVASDPLALIGLTNKFIYLDDGQIAKLSLKSIDIYDSKLSKVNKQPILLNLSKESVGKDGFDFFMEKEIFEQPTLLLKCLENLIDFPTNQPRFTFDLQKIDKIIMTACGSSYHSCLIGKFLFESKLSIPIEVDYSSEIRYRDTHFDENTLIICASQSGETADLLFALVEAKKKGAKIISLLNKEQSSIEMISDFVLPINAGVEIGVASTKAFTCQLMVFYYLSEVLSKQADFGKLATDIKPLIVNIMSIFAKKDVFIECSKLLFQFQHILYLGRNILYPIALEGALKMKEITYKHAECYPSGELKHGHIALVDETLPVIFLIPEDKMLEKNLSNMQEVLARKGKVILFSTKNIIDKFKDDLFFYVEMPANDVFYTISYSIALQLLAFYTAKALGRDIDKPRNLAKSVTVE